MELVDRRLATVTRKTTNEKRIEMLAARLARMRVPLGFLCAGAVL